ncbi:sensor histidine kinase [Pedosphaera parvula]|uniref:histidine kinase n=1 Tax=Pedosphaera parvula (strain Ellin514) TaxID=320771 RepID=B9XCN4_PEDPL|nr:transporter substrate-binding domain-containing protein [Pedosphaera parvula]EEF62230.1 histidine kinase [Pedosphaera parvula Ellin514]
MKRTATRDLRLIWILCLLAGSFLVTAIGNAQTNLNVSKPVRLSEAEKAWLRQHPVVYWGVDPHWPPFSSFDRQGRASGINVEMVELIAKRAGLNIKLVQTPAWSETLRKADTREIDFIGGIARTEERERLHGLKFTEAYCSFPTAIITRENTPFFTPLEELIKSLRIALPRNYATTEELLRDYSGARAVLTDTEEESMLAVAGNKADATVLNLASASYIVHMRGLANLKISGFTDPEFYLRLAVRNDMPELHSILEKGLATIDKREAEAIYAKYILPGTLEEINWRTWRRRVIYFILIGGAALVGALLWNRKLAGEIRRREAAEIDLRRVRDQLEKHTRELDRHATEMQGLNERLVSANKDLESFSSSVSHDLKSPLRRLRSFVDLLQEDAGDTLNAEGRECLAIINHEARRMGQLIEDLLAFSRVGRSEMHLAPVNLEQLVNEVVRDVQLETKGREIIWQIEPLPEVRGDRALLRQAVVNLIDNAVKFTRGRSPARINFGVLPAKPDDKEVTFYIRDNGSGFDMNYAYAIFEAFQRLHSQEEFEGTGIGLANVQRIIQRHGGRVWAEGEVNKGATFYFTLPRKMS